MSLLRFSAPGQPTFTIDQGPQLGRVHRHRYEPMGGTMISPVRKPPSISLPTQAERDRMKARRDTAKAARIVAELNPVPRPRCGAWMPVNKETCARMPGHKDCHRGEWLMAEDRKRRMSVARRLR